MGLVERTQAFGTADCRRFRAAIFQRHHAISGALAGGFLRRARTVGGNYAGNVWLREMDAALSLGDQRTSAVMDDDDVVERAGRLATKCEQTYVMVSTEGVAPGGGAALSFPDLFPRQPADFSTAVEAVQRIVEGYGVPWPVEIRKRDTPEDIRNKLASAVARASDPLWWRRQLRKVSGRRTEAVMRHTGVVRRGAAPYVSDWAYRRWRAAQRRNAAMIGQLDAVADGDDGEQVLPLSVCVEASVANPINRRNELMTRMRGWEEIATAMGLCGAMLTLTAPGRYHAQLHAGGVNPRYNGADPSEVMDYLCGVWSRIRADWHRAGIKAFGFRMTEPHHDGTPHCHFLLFFSPDQVDRAWEIFREHALAVDGDESGAEKYRADRKDIDPAKGTAAGYVAKYVAKNIDGFGMDGDEVDDEGDCGAREGAARVRAWASLWGIRQFQQIGAVSVTVYRELRRCAEPLAWEPAEVEEARAAADAGDWARFVELMGGGFVRRNDQLLRPLRELGDRPGRYGEEVRRLLGLVLGRLLSGYVIDFCLRWQLRTREVVWKIVPRWARQQAGASPPVTLDLCQ